MKKSPDEVMRDERPSRKYGLDMHGIEYPDPTPVEVPTRLQMPQRQVDRVRSIIRQEISSRASQLERETFEEADDFVMDDVEPFSPYEEVFEPLTSVSKDVRVDSPGNSGVKEKSHGKASAVDGGGSGGSSEGVVDASEVVRKVG